MALRPVFTAARLLKGGELVVLPFEMFNDLFSLVTLSGEVILNLKISVFKVHCQVKLQMTFLPNTADGFTLASMPG